MLKVAFAVAVLAITPAHAAIKRIKLEQHNGTYSVPVLINGKITMNFIVDTGANDVAIPIALGKTLRIAGTIPDKDIGARFQTVTRFRKRRIVAPRTTGARRALIYTGKTVHLAFPESLNQSSDDRRAAQGLADPSGRASAPLRRCGNGPSLI